MTRVDYLSDVLALTRIPNRDVSQPQRVIELLVSGLQGALDLVDPGTLTPPKEIFDAARCDMKSWLADGIKVVCVTEDQYPRELVQVREAPALLYYEGNLAGNDRAIAVVGSRKASQRALNNASRISRELVSAGYSVAAGLASGIDTAAHWAALEAGGRTVAVMGTGIGQTYPSVNTQLRHAIAGNNGLVLTQFEPDQGPTRYSFPMRNAVMSGYCLATIIVEAGEHSGTRIQARKALQHGKNVILLAPVVQQNKWAYEIANTPGVYVVKDLDQLRGTLEEVEQNLKILAAV